MDEPESSPLPPLPIGDTLGAPVASPDALRQILRRHRRRQTAIGGAGLAAVLVVGSLGGWALGRHDRGGGGGVRVAAGGQPTAAAHASAPAPSSGAAGMAIGGGSPIGQMVSSPSTQLLVRDAADGTRVRLYEQSLAAPKVTCSTGQPCPEAPVAVCGPSSFVSAEVSDDQVAGQTGNAVWQATPSGPLETLGAEVVGAGQPQPILVVVARTASPTATVTLTTAYGTDVETPTAAGWVALAVRLPSDFATDGSTGLPTGKLVAADSGASTTSSSDLGTVAASGPMCQVGTCTAVAVPDTAPSAGSASPPASVVTGAPTVSGCPCPPATLPPPSASGTGAGPAVPQTAIAQSCSVSVGGTVVSGGSGGGVAGAGTVPAPPDVVNGTSSSGSGSSGSSSGGSGSAPAPATP